MADDQKPYRSRRLRDVDPIWPVNVFTPVCACPHGDNDLNEGDYCPICHKLWKRAEQHKSMIRSPLTDPKPEPKKKHAPELPGGTGSLKAKSEWELAGVGKVKAWTKSEARAAFKVMLGVPRLPVGSKVKKV